jgi:hypothetical protein
VFALALHRTCTLSMCRPTVLSDQRKVQVFQLPTASNLQMQAFRYCNCCTPPCFSLMVSTQVSYAHWGPYYAVVCLQMIAFIGHLGRCPFKVSLKLLAAWAITSLWLLQARGQLGLTDDCPVQFQPPQHRTPPARKGVQSAGPVRVWRP